MSYVTLSKRSDLRKKLVSPNTIYEVKRNYNLRGKTLNIPGNCVLFFNGGSISNGRVILNNTKIISESICFKRISSFSGIIKDTFNIDWVSISETDDVTSLIQNIFDVSTSSKSVLCAHNERTYHIMDIEITNKSDFGIDCNCIFKFPDRMPAEKGQVAHHIIRISDCDNFTIKKLRLDGNSINNYCREWDVQTKNAYNVAEANYKNEYRHCLSLYNCHNASLNKILGVNPCGDVVTLGGHEGLDGNAHLIFDTIEGVSVDNQGNGRACGRNVVSVINGNHLSFNNVYSYYVGHATMPGGFDIEPNHNENQYCEYITVNKIYHEGKANEGLGIGGTVYGHVSHIVIHEATIKNYQIGKEQRPVDILGVDDLTIDKLEIYPTFESSGLSINVSGPRPYSQNITIKDLYIENSGNAIQICNVDNVNIKARIHNWSKNAVYFISKEGALISNGTLDITAYTDVDAECAPERFFQFNSQVKNIKLSGNLDKTNMGKGLVSLPIYVNDDIEKLDVDVKRLSFKGYNKHNRINWKK